MTRQPMQWDPEQYGQFAAERARPFIDLLAHINTGAPHRVTDLGCGPGTMTTLLAAMWPDAEIVGVDSSAQMIESAQRLATGSVRFEVGDLADWSGAADTDVLLTNSALQWVPDHLFLLDAWIRAMPTGGWLAMQVPANFDAPSHLLMRELAESSRWRAQLGGVLRHSDAVAGLAAYWRVLTEGGAVVDAWDTTYLHVLSGTDPVLEWVRGTGLRPVLAALPPDDAAEFEHQYAAELRLAYPGTATGTLYPFTRRFAVAHKI